MSSISFSKSVLEMRIQFFCVNTLSLGPFLCAMLLTYRDKRSKVAKEKLMDYHAKEAAKAQVSVCSYDPL